MTYTVSM